MLCTSLFPTNTGAKHHNKLMDESSSRVRTMDNKLNTTPHDSCVEFDRERACSNSKQSYPEKKKGERHLLLHEMYALLGSSCSELI